MGRTQGYCGFVVMCENIWSDFEYSSSRFLLGFGFEFLSLVLSFVRGVYCR